MYMYVQLLRAILEFGGRSKRTSELFETATPLSMTRKFFKGLKVSCLSISQHNFYAVLWLFALRRPLPTRLTCGSR